MRCVRVFGWLAIFFLAVLFGQSAGAQDDPNFETGIKPYGSYHAGNIDVIDLLNAGLSVDIPLMEYPQTGGRISFGFSLHFVDAGYYYTVGYIYDDYGDVIGTTTDWENSTSIPGWTIRQDDIPVARIQTIYNSDNSEDQVGSITMSDGAVHQLAPLSLSGPWRVTDGSGFQVSSSQPTVTDSDGVTYTNGGYLFDGGSGSLYIGGQTAQTIQDSNGNTISTSPGSGNHINGWTDTLGRNIGVPYAQTNLSRCPSVPSPATEAVEWDLRGPNGGTYPLLFCAGGSVPDSYYFWNTNGGQGSGWQQQSSGSGPVLQSLVLPDNTYWTFQYTTDGNQNLSQITFPTGGNLCYSWNNPTIGGSTSNYYEQDHQVATRKLDPGACSPSSPTWTYSINGLTNIVTDAAGNDTTHSFSNIANSAATLETETQVFQGSHTSGSWVKTITTNYVSTASTTDNIEPGAVPTQVTTSWPSGQASEVQYSYDGGFTAGVIVMPANQSYFNWSAVSNTLYGKEVTRQEYDYGGSLLRTTNTAYQFQNNGNYLNANLLNLPASVQITGAGPGSYTTFSYDESGSPQCVCGNQTSVHRLLNTTNAYLVTSSEYDANGRVLSVTDPKGNPPTTFGYGSCYAGSGPTSITNALSQTTTFCYDLNTGLQTSATDPNSQTTSTSYDNMLRTSQITYPKQTLADGSTLNGQTTFGYPNANEVQISELIDDHNNQKNSTLLVDGLGRKSQTQLTSDPDGTDYTVTTYDGMGRVATVTNPYRSASDSTYGVTSYVYDPLGRTQSVTEQDGSVVRTDYSNFPCVTATDESGRERQSCTDGLGRMTSVIEDPAGLNYQTSYGYDALDNLIGVTQVGSHQRTFGYDSLSRLTSAANPESGTTTYSYDADGNVATKTDARNIQTTYSYDQLNRLTQKTYSDGTPSPYYWYDLGNTWNYTTTNSIGRMVLAGVNNIAGDVYSYDAMGRVNNQWQCTPLWCGSGMNQRSYTYDLLGGLTSYATIATGNFPSITFTQTRSTADRVTQITSSYTGNGYPGTLWSGIHYSPAGTVAQATNGNNLTQSYVLNARLQTCRINLNSSGTTLQSCTDPVPSGNLLDFSYGFNYGSSDNGDILTWSATGQQSFNRMFSYDAVNRLWTMSAPGSTCSGLSWSYDSWGNRNAQNATGGTCDTFSQFADGNNHFGSPYQYDAAGNMTYDGVHTYTYDAENRITQVDGGNTATYQYNGVGQRVHRILPTFSFDYVYDISGQAVAEIDGNNNWNRFYIYNGTSLGAEYLNGSTDFIQSDHLGSTRLMTTMTGSLLDSFDYYPFGEDISGYETSHQFTGQEFDSESNLYNFPARHYGEATGRFMSPDPLGGHLEDPQTLNKYSYVRNNPLTLTDPTGLDFYLKCDNHGEHSTTCSGGYVGKWVLDANGKPEFQKTIITSDSIRSGQNAATVDQGGVEITTGGKTYAASYFDNPSSYTRDASGNDIDNNPITIQGDANKGFGGFSFTVNGNCSGTCLNSGEVKFTGTPDQASSALYAAGAWNYGFWDGLNYHHLFSDQYRFGSGPSLHISLPWQYAPIGGDARAMDNPLYTVPASGEFHTDATTGFSHAVCSNVPGISCSQ